MHMSGCGLSDSEVQLLITNISSERASSDEHEQFYAAFAGLIRWQASKFRPHLHFEELVSEGKVALYEAILSYDPAKGKFSTLATTAIRNRMVTFMRAENKQLGGGHRIRFYPGDPVHEDQLTLDDLAADDTTEAAVADAYFYHSRLLPLRAALLTLPERQFQAVALAYYDDKKPSEIADILRVSRPAVTALLSRASISLRKQLDC